MYNTYVRSANEPLRFHYNGKATKVMKVEYLMFVELDLVLTGILLSEQANLFIPSVSRCTRAVSRYTATSSFLSQNILISTSSTYMNKCFNKCETKAELQSTCGHQTSTSHTASLTSHNEPDRWWRQGILGCEVGGRHLALPFTIVKLQCGSSDPQAAVPRVLAARPLILLDVYANWLQQRGIASYCWSFSEALEQGWPTSTHRTVK